MRKRDPNIIYIIVSIQIVVAILLILSAIKNGAPVLDVAQCIGGIVAVALAIGGVFWFLDRFYHKKMARSEAVARLANKQGGWLAGILAVFVVFAVSNLSYKLLEYLVICHVYGPDAWAHGLRVISKQNGLSNGEFLAGWPAVILNLGTFFITAIIGLGSFVLFRNFGFWIRGRKLNDGTT
jgi:hypothetical protein